MKTTKQLTLLFTLLLGVYSCKNGNGNFDAQGTFETDETIISAEANGVLESFKLEEGQTLQAGDLIGTIDSTQLYLKKKQLQSQIQSTLSQRPNIASQIAALQVQIKTAETEKKRIENLVKADAATTKQLDDVTAQLDVLQKQLVAQQTALNITSESISQATNPIEVQIEQLDDQLAKCRIINPIKGQVLSKYANEKEMVSAGKPLYKIADISTLYLKAYISGTQLNEIKLNQKVNVFTDGENAEAKGLEGTITWISDKSEFTPKTIQTKEERANLVYAIKIKVQNNGLLKIGQYGEVKFQ